jgi:hypothetical protein
LVISHRHGSNVNIYRTDEDARAAPADYVDDWWDREMAKFEMRRPDDSEQMVSLYFEYIKDERFEIPECEVAD